ncbi:ABC transporter ATP-binding protein [Clostridia bacterium]|nr:ABC transporter ATP-binding protein [Clostridia bacterium]
MKQLWGLLKQLKNYKKAAILAPTFIMGSVLMDLLLPAIMQRMIDIGVANKDLGYIGKMSILMLGAAIVGLVSGLVCNYYASIASQSLGGDLRDQVFGKIMRLSRGNVDRLETGQLITRATNDVNQVQQTVLMGLKVALRGPFLLLGGLAMAVVTSPGLTRVIAFMLPILIVGVVLLIRFAFPMFSKVQERIDAVNGVIGENLSGIRVIKAFVRGDFEKKRFGKVNEDLYQTSTIAYQRIALMMPLILIVSNMAIVGALYLGGVNFANGSIQIGQIQAFINYLGLIMMGLMMMAMVLMTISRAAASAKRIQEILDQQSDIQDMEKALQEVDIRGKIEFKNVCFDYDKHGADCVLKDLNFTIEPGEKVAILGATGSGKSTLIHLIPRFYDVTQGQVLIDDIDVKTISKSVLRKQIGIALQAPLLFSGSIEDNLRFAKPDASFEELQRGAQIAQANEFIEAMPDGYKTELGQKGVNLSGGQKQRLSIARAIISDPAILILDDSTSAVDVETETKLQKEMEEVLAGRTSITIAQRISTVLLADKILVLDDGMLRGIGSHEELMQTSDIYRDIYESQLGGINDGQ